MKPAESWILKDISGPGPPCALGIAAASFLREGGDGAEKDTAESPTAELEAKTERPKKIND